MRKTAKTFVNIYVQEEFRSKEFKLLKLKLAKEDSSVSRWFRSKVREELEVN